MTLNSDNIKIFKADTPTDDDDGGGLQTNNEVQDGVDNNVFPDISQLDGVYGRSHLRKVFAAVKAQNTDPLLGAHFIFTEIPKDPKVSVCAFQTTGKAGDRRAQAQEHVERYLAEGTLFLGALMEKQLKGQRAITILTLISSPAPTAGNSIVLSHDENGVKPYSEFVRVISVSSAVRQFVINENGDTKPLAVHTCELSASLKNDYQGFTPQEVLKGLDNVFRERTRIRETRVADASKYYSARPLAKPATVGQASITVDTIYTYIVPSAQSELALVNMNMIGKTTTMVSSGGVQTFITNLTVSTASTSTVVSSGIARGSLKITLTNGDVLTDDGAGLVMQGTRNVGTLKYDTGVITWVTTVFTYTGSATFEFIPAFPNVQTQYTDFINVTESNRGLLWVYTLDPKPARGTLQIIYTYSGKNYILYDNGDGTISGVASGIGSGTINYETATISITLNAYPDMGSAIIFQWGDKLVELNASDEQDVELKAMFDGGLAILSPKRTLTVDPTITWNIGDTAYTATINKESGEVTGDATGVVLGNQQEFKPKILPPIGTVFNTSSLLDRGLVDDTKTVTGTMEDGVITFANVLNSQPEGVNIQKGTLKFSFGIRMTAAENSYNNPNSQTPSQANISSMECYDIPNSNGVTGRIYNVPASDLLSTQQGTINYSTGTITLTPNVTFRRWRKTSKVKEGSGYYGYLYTTVVSGVQQFNEVVVDVSSVSLGGVVFTVKTQANSEVPVSSTATLTGYKTVIKGVTGYSLDPSKISFRVGNYGYTLNDGAVARTSLSSSTGLAVGTYTLDRGTIEVRLTEPSWNDSVGNKITWLMVGVEAIEIPQNSFTFLTPVNPLRNGSFQLNLFLDGEWKQFMADSNGEINNDSVVGKVNYLTGLVQLNLFRVHRNVSYSFYAGVVSENPDLSDGTNMPSQMYSYNSVTGNYDVTAPIWAVPSNINYNAIALTYLPLDAEILKLDPIRLPADGRVPCFRNADVIVLTKTITKELPSPVIGNKGNVGESILSFAKVTDSQGQVVGSTEIEVDLDSGDYEVLPAFVGSNYAFPITITCKAQDMAMLSDVQVSGQLTLSVPLLHSYPEGSIVSSAIILGDKQPRVYNYFQQQTWDNVWEDAQKGANISAKYNFVASPITVTNAGALKERWALVFTSSSTFRIIGETVGEIGTGNTASICKPINPLTNEPYFTIPEVDGWGSGWVNGNTLRFNTEASSSPVWLARTILQGHTSKEQDGFTIQLRGDIDNEN